MLIEIVHQNGKRYTIPVLQVVTMTDEQGPVAVAYETAGLMVYTDATKADFSAAVQQLGLSPQKVTVYEG